MPQPDAAASLFWNAVTRLGEAQILLPAALALLLWMALHPAARKLGQWWLAMIVLAAALTTASKVAFIGFAIGVPEINFTGISGHAMFAAVVYPPLARVLAAAQRPAGRCAALAAGWALALLVGASRWVVHAHSGSEVLAGLALGGAAGGLALALAQAPAARLPVWLPIGLAAWLLATPANAPPSPTHGMVTRLSLAVSGRSAPYTRAEMLRDWRRRQRDQLQIPDATRGAAAAGEPAVMVSGAVVDGQLLAGHDGAHRVEFDPALANPQHRVGPA